MYGDNTIYINEASTKLLKSNGQSTDLRSTNDPTVWWKKDLTATVGGASLFSVAASNTSDLMPSTVSARIQLANGQALSVQNGNLVQEDYDRLSSAQAWTYLD